MCHPAVSVVIAVTRADPVLADCLAALEASAGAIPIEILLADGSPEGVPTSAYPDAERVTLVRAEGRRSLPFLRGAAMARATARLIAVIDPYCLVSREWIPNVVRLHHERPEPVVGGPVELDATHFPTLASWTGYLFEYWEFAPPVSEGPTPVLSGNNLVYKREVLGTTRTLEREGFWKAFVNARLQAAGARFWMSPALAVRLRKAVPLGRFLASRFHHGRSYAAMRVSGDARWLRMVRAVTAPALPFLFLLRQAQHLWRRPQVRRRFLATLPVMAVAQTIWALGELVGYALGPGKSHERLEF